VKATSRTNIISIVSFILIFSTTSLMSQTRISGFVRDSLTREVLIGTHVIDSITNRAVVTDNNGFFSISTTAGNQLTFSFVGYQPKTITIDKSKSSLVEVLLLPGTDIDEVVVTHTRRPAFNISSLSNIELQQIPSLGAKPDVMKSIQLLPGISSQYEGSSLISVRGGNPGENLYLFDNVAVIYVNHLGGFMSVFNPDMINNIDIYKGGFPSRYGGRLSSIMDIAQREGNPNNLSSSLSVGVTDVTFTVDGPVDFIENSSFMFTGRKTLVDPLLGLFTYLNGGSTNMMAYGFHDFNGKFTWKPNPENTLSFNLYQGDDYLGIFYKSSKDDFIKRARITNTWGNWLLSARWNKVHRPGLYSNQSLSFVRYRLREKQVYQNIESDNPYKRRYLSAVQDISYKWGWKADLKENWNIDFGFQSSYFRHLPNSITISTQDRQGLDEVNNSLETGIYMDNNWTIGRFLQLRAGARGVGYLSNGLSKAYLEPRLNLDVNLARNHTLNLSYMEVTQFSHLLFTSGTINNNEVWIPSDKKISPANSRQISAGWRASFIEGLFDAEVNVYHKTLENLASYREGYVNLMGDGNWKNKVETGGTGEAWGAEFFLRKNLGKWNGFASYTWSRATRQFENINKGEEYLYDYDRPHNFAISLNREISKKLSLNAAWVFESGIPFTPVVGRMFTPSTDYFYSSVDDPHIYEAFIYGERNSERMRNYHRLDLALHYSYYTKRNKNRAQWSFSVYNVYNRKNPNLYFYTHDKFERGIFLPIYTWRRYEPFSLYQISFFPILPTLSYKVFFE
jgi:hypothetical protein